MAGLVQSFVSPGPGVKVLASEAEAAAAAAEEEAEEEEVGCGQPCVMLLFLRSRTVLVPPKPSLSLQNTLQ